MNIGALARQTGIKIATLRKWEIRYGFPSPLRTETGRREYSVDTVDQLLAIRRQMSGGVRPGKVIQAFLSSLEHDQTPHDDCIPSHGTSLLLRSETLNFREWLNECRQQMNAADFVERVAAPMAREVGNLWVTGKLPVFAEHVFSEEMQRVLVAPHAQDVSVKAKPRILLTAPAGEKHTLGLHMAGAVLAASGEASLKLTADLPTAEIVAAAIHYEIVVVGLTASVSYPPKLLMSCLRELRAELPASVQLWAGGEGIARLPQLPENITQIKNMQELLQRLETLPPRKE